ncbi:MAG TPA: 4-alpha-glucanotransferase [Steroidobacteraceae bacterium]|nr:4-alpha-glucanotransferase [Steroidobacteraceae bacterium]
MLTRTPVLSRRRAGALLHLTSLEAALGRGGRAFIDWLAEAGFSVWQFLPVGPTNSDGSPYRARSDSAGNPQLIDPAERAPLGTGEHTAFLHAARGWLDDYASYEVLSRMHGGAPWWSWPTEHRDRDPQALAEARRTHAAQIEEIEATQFAFAWQWRRLREYARSRGVFLFGDLPFYVAPDSAETWAQRRQFQLDEHGAPRAVAGVPPDYFSRLGQLWGNPLYDWEVMREDGFSFWRTRLVRQLERVDLLRIDHFRALAAHWAVPADAPDARAGAWKRTPGWALLRMVREELGELPFVAEDLGVITPDVVDLRRGFALPGMRVLQFAFDGASDNPHLPHMHERGTVVYTGTHDNDTALGWFASLEGEAAHRVGCYLGLAAQASPEARVDALTRVALGSVCLLTVLPVQDLLVLGSAARFNTPATSEGNWSWKLPAGLLTAERAARFLELNRIYGRA